MRLVSTFSPINSPQSFFTVSKLNAVSGINAAVLFDSYEPVQNIYYFTGTTELPNNKFIYAANGTNLIIPQDPISTQELTSVIQDTTSFVYDNGVLAASGTLPAGTLSSLSIGNVRGNPTPVANGYDWFGSIQELTVYPTNQSLRTSVQSNINTYYQIYWQGNGTALLDSYSGASAAYSLRNLSSAYTGPLIRVRRSNDNVERDIYGTFRGDLDLAALTSFVGANSGFVTRWYDQSGIGDNLLLQSQTFENASWLKTNVTASTNTILAPDGTLTAETIFETAATDLHYMYQTNSTSAGVYTLSLYIKYLNRKYIILGVNDASASGAGVVFDVEIATFVGNSTIGTGYSVLSYSITNLSDGWSRYSVTVSTSGAAMGILQLRNSNSLSWLNSYTGNSSTGVYIWGAQLSTGSQLLRYQPTTTAIAPVRNATQATAASQPRIVNAGAVDTLNGKPSVFTNATNVSFSTLTLSDFTLFWVSRKADSGPAGSMILSGPSFNYVSDDSDSAGNPVVNSSGPIVRLTLNNTSPSGPEINQHLSYANRRNGTQAVGQFNNSENTYNNSVISDQLSLNTIGIYPPVPSYAYNGHIQEILMYPDDRSSSRTGMSSNINNYYKIY
jgi:hypothetical protein